MKYPMPTIDLREYGILTKAAFDMACWDLSRQREDPEWADIAAKSNAEFVAWVNYGREAFPDQQSGYMLDCETHFGCRLPFDFGDRWEVEGDDWVIVKVDGTRINTRTGKKP